jgi:YkoY family integral membrane protein
MTLQTLLVILNLFIIESLLSVDNASALAAMVQHLPQNQRNKALRYGLLGAYVFRGTCLFFASWLIKILWLKIAGGIYLFYLAYKFFSSNEEGSEISKTVTKGFLATIISVEILDLSLSIDNIFAAVALSKEFWVIMVGVAIGILAMRFVAGWFVKLIEKYPSLVKSAFIVIALLGIKLIASGIIDYIPSWAPAKEIIEDHSFDFAFSAIMMVIFFYPLAFGNKKVPEKILLTEEGDPSIIPR